MERVKELKNEGNAYYVREEFIAALGCYTQGLSLDPKNTTLLMNRCGTFLRIGNYTACIQDADKVLESDVNNVKAYYRKGRALIGVSKYSEAVKTLRKASSLDPNEREIIAALKEAESKENEGMGYFDIVKLLDQEHRYPETPLTLEEYNGPIRVSEVEGKGRGIVAEEDIPPGSTVMICKAIAIVYSSENIKPEQSRVELFKRVAQKLSTDKQAALSFCDLRPQKENVTKSSRITSVILANLFDVYNEHFLSRKADFDACSSGVWINASFFNHSCVDWNCFWFVIGDCMFVRTVKQVKKDEELLISYFSSAITPAQRIQSLEEKCIQCKCRLCEIDNSTDPSKLQQLSQIRYRIQDETSSEEIHQLINEMDAMRPGKRHLLPDLHQLYRLLASGYLLTGQNKLAVKNFKKGIELLNRFIPFSNDIFTFCYPLVLLYEDIGEKDEAAKWKAKCDFYCNLAYGAPYSAIIEILSIK